MIAPSMLFAIVLQSGAPQAAPPAPTLPAPTLLERPLRIVELSGSGFERGVAHGKALKKEIHELLELWRKDLRESYGLPADGFIARFLEKTSFEDAIQAWTPDLLEEIRGIAEGAGVSRDEMYVFQLIDEVWANAREIAPKHCTSIGVTRRGSQPTFVAQNLDLEGFCTGFQTVLHLKGPKPGHEAFVLTLPGLVGANGLNNRAVAITCNTLLDLQHGSSGLPVACIVRGVLEQDSLDEALRFLREVPHASGQNYIVGGRERALSLECSAHKVTEFVPWEGAALTYHTNHARANDDLDPKRGGKGAATRCDRFAALEKRLKDRDAPIDLDVIKEALSSRDSERNPISNSGTFACTIMELGESPLLHIAPGRTHETLFRTLRFDGTPATAAGSR